MRVTSKAIGLAAASVGLVSLTGCHPDMWRQPKVLPLSENSFFLDKQGSRPQVAGTVPRNPRGATVDMTSLQPARREMQTGNPFYTGLENGKLVQNMPAKAMEYFGNDRKKMLYRGQERFNIFCSPCHGRLGDGRGMIALRGLNLRRKPASYHEPRLLNYPDGHFFSVITNGFGVMYSYSSRIDPEDRWAIVAYIRALQYSQNARLEDVPQNRVSELDTPLEQRLRGAEEPTNQGGAKTE